MEHLYLPDLSDITDRKKAEAAFKSSEQRFRIMFEEAPLGIALIDSLSCVLYDVNSKYGQIVGRSPEQMNNLDYRSPIRTICSRTWTTWRS